MRDGELRPRPQQAAAGIPVFKTAVVVLLAGLGYLGWKKYDNFGKNCNLFSMETLSCIKNPQQLMCTMKAACAVCKVEMTAAEAEYLSAKADSEGSLERLGLWAIYQARIASSKMKNIARGATGIFPGEEL